MLVENLVPLFGSRSKAQEIIYLFNDVKKVVRHGFYPEEIAAVETYCLTEHIKTVRSKFKVITEESGYSNKGIRVEAMDPRRGMFFLYLSKDEKLAELARDFEDQQDDKNLGFVLGYPNCCIDFFCANFSENNVNPQIESSNPFTDISGRDKDIVIISHFPCKEDCVESVILGKKYLSVLDGARKEELQVLWK
jgi:hypothetical protein